MWMYQVMGYTVVPGGTVLYLPPEQISSRLHGLKALPQEGWFRSIKELPFKPGEVLGFENPPKYYLLKNLQAMGVNEKSEHGQTLESTAAACIDNPKLLSELRNFSFLEQIAWQRVQAEGRLTIKAYQKCCRRVSRRSLQRVLKGMVEKNILMREGATHRLCYRFREN